MFGIDDAALMAWLSSMFATAGSEAALAPGAMNAAALAADTGASALGAGSMAAGATRLSDILGNVAKVGTIATSAKGLLGKTPDRSNLAPTLRPASQIPAYQPSAPNFLPDFLPDTGADLRLAELRKRGFA